MKLNKIILGLTVCAGLFTACTSEEQIGGTPEGEATTFSIKIASSDAATKAIATNYKYATDDEINVNNVMVAVFKANGTSVGDLVSGPTTVSASDLTVTTSSDGKKAYEITNLVGKTGSAYILVIANSSADYSACKSYSDFAEVTASVQDGKSFVSNNLVKVGIQKENLSPATTKSIYEVPMNQVAARIDLKLNPADGLTYQFNKVTVANINTKSDILINGTNTQDATVATTVFNLTAAADTFSFYTFENPISTKRIKVSFEGTLTETATNNVTANKVYSFTFNENILHGYVYDVKGTLDASTRKMNFTWNLLAWGGSRETEANIQQAKYLVVKDLNISMPNENTFTTTFASSSPIKSISNLTVKNGSTSANTVSNTSITYDQNVNNGNITITSRIPINFVPDTITFTVTNNDNLSQNVTVMQYPPLYITSTISLHELSGSGNSNQNNRSMYEFTSLVADFSTVKEPLELSETSFQTLGSDWNSNGEAASYGTGYHRKTLSYRQGLAQEFVNFINQYAVLGYPKTINKYFNKPVYTKVNGVYQYQAVASADVTVQTSENNYLISPHFVLASQNGTNYSLTGITSEEWCAGYVEQDLNGVSYPENQPGKWRVPTKAELLLIDILQNTSDCAVKRILEGEDYWCATPELINLMDPRLTGAKAVRCVRDIK